jgi:hypothetical protein
VREPNRSTVPHPARFLDPSRLRHRREGASLPASRRWPSYLTQAQNSTVANVPDLANPQRAYARRAGSL